MATTLLQAPVGAGKTEIALQTLLSTVNNPPHPFVKIWMLFATKRQEAAFRQRLTEPSPQRQVFFNVEFFNFYELNARLLNLAGRPPRRIHEAARAGILRLVIDELLAQGELRQFRPIAHTPGFLRVTADFIYELKQNRIYPDLFTGAALLQKDRELARIYARYQEYVQQHKLVDREGEGWLALEEISRNENAAADVDLLLVDGYDQFTPVQAQLLALLSSRIKEVKITLTEVPKRGTRRFGERFEQSRQRLIDEHNWLGIPLEIETLSAPVYGQHPDLAHLGSTIFDTSAPPAGSTRAIRLIEAPGPRQETAAVLRAVKRLILESGARPDDILIAVRDWGRYHTHIEHYTRHYRLPALLHHYADSLADNPAIDALFAVLDLAQNHFARRNLLDALSSPYIDAAGLGTAQIAALDRISRQFQVIRGETHWLESIEQASRDFDDEDGEIIEALLTDRESSDLSINLETFFNHVKAPTHAPIEKYIAWLENLIGPDDLLDPDLGSEEYDVSADYPYSLNLLRQIRQMDAPPYVIARDLSAINTFMEILRGFLSTDALLRATSGQEVSLTWRQFHEDLKSAIRSASLPSRTADRSGRILVTTAADARGLPHQHVFILGLSEGLFPAKIPEDALYLDSERQSLRQRGIKLQTQTERADDEGLFYELISLPRQTLTLSRPTIQDGKPWIESHLWRGVKAAFSDLPMHRIGIGTVSHPQDASSYEEAALALAANFDKEIPSQTILGLYNWLMQNPSQRQYWQHIQRARLVEAGRLSDQLYDSYSGRLMRPELIEWTAQTLGPDRVWSASQFNEYGLCGFRFFARRMLRLEAFEEPEEGLDSRQLGTLYHSILEETYRRIDDYGLDILQESQKDALGILQRVLDEKLASAPNDIGFRPSPLWEQQQQVIRRRVEAIVRLDFSSQSPLNISDQARTPFRQEMKFGWDDFQIDLGPDVGLVRVRGQIDRIDRVGDTYIVIDYKTGSSGIPVSEMIGGRNFQMMVYLLAADHLTNRRRKKVGMFWHLRTQKISGKIELDENGLEILERAVDYLSIHIEAARKGNFLVRPSAPDHQRRCVSYCEYHSLCRASIMHPYKQEE